MAQEPRKPRTARMMFQPGPVGAGRVMPVAPAFSAWTMGGGAAPPGFNPTMALVPVQQSVPSVVRPNQRTNWMQVFGQADRAAGQAVLRQDRSRMLGPQGQHESRIGAAARNLTGWLGAANTAVSPMSTFGALNSGIAPAVRGAGRAVANEAVAFGRWLTETPTDQSEREFRILVGLESNGRQFGRDGKPLTSPKGAIGIAQVMPGTGPEAAKLAGLPWDPNRYKNDAAYNYQLGLAYFRAQRQRFGDPVLAAAAYNAGPGRAQSAQQQAARTGQPVQAFLPQETQNYMSNFMQRMGGMAAAFGAPAPAFNPAPYQQAMDAVNAAAALQSRPYSATFTETPIPDRPAPTEFAAPDFSKGDAAFQATMPTNPFDDPREKRKIGWSYFAKGIGQAMASLSGGEGIGTMLMKMGAGALMGKAAGDDYIRDREEKYEAMMAEYNRALANREDQKAGTIANVLNKNIEQRNQYAEQLWADNAQKIQKFNPQVVGNELVTYSRDEKNPNQVTMTRTPLGFGPQAEALMKNAQIGLQMGNAMAESQQFAFQHQQTVARTALGITMQQALQQDNGQAVGEAITTEAAARARAAVRAGNWADLFNDKGLAASIEQSAVSDAYRQLGVTLHPKTGLPLQPLTGEAASRFNDLREDFLTQRIYETAAQHGQITGLLVNPAASRAWATQQSGSMRQSIRRDSRGRTTTTTSFSMDE